MENLSHIRDLSVEEGFTVCFQMATALHRESDKKVNLKNHY